MRRIPSRAILLAVLLGGCASTGQVPAPQAALDKPEPAKLIAAAENARGEGDCVAALDLYHAVLKDAPEDAEARLGVAECALETGETEDAAGQFAKLTDVELVRARALQGRGIALMRLGRDGDAADALNGAVALDAKLWRAWNGLGRLTDLKPDHDEAQRDFARALEFAPNSAAVHNNMGVSLLMQDKPVPAADEFREALRLDRTLETARNNLRLALAAQGRYVEAAAGAKPAEMPVVLNNIGYVALRRGDYKAAEAYFSRALEISPAFFAPAWTNLTHLKALTGIEADPDAAKGGI